MVSRSVFNTEVEGEQVASEREREREECDKEFLGCSLCSVAQMLHVHVAMSVSALLCTCLTVYLCLRMLVRLTMCHR